MSNPQLMVHPARYWNCDIPGHHHHTEESARHCMERQAAHRNKLLKGAQYKKRNITIVRDFLTRSRTVEQLATHHRVSLARISQIVISEVDKSLRRNRLSAERLNMQGHSLAEIMMNREKILSLFPLVSGENQGS